MVVIEEKLALSRQKLIALSLLCGCDYNDKGVLGVGKETALKFLEQLEDDEVLPRWEAIFDIMSGATGVVHHCSSRPAPDFPHTTYISYALTEFFLSSLCYMWQVLCPMFINVFILILRPLIFLECA
jgi:hypothetical protein